MSTAATAPTKPATEPTERSIWAGDDDEQHAERHDDDVAVLEHQIGQVERLQQRAASHDLEEQHDRDQRHQHAVIAQIVLDEAAVPALLGQRNRLVGHGCDPPISAPARALLP
ncbi:Spy/CpxP family protein refolding chaperone [Bradyrhizobium sp. GM22.5]